jgi:hypothetical protein
MMNFQADYAKAMAHQAPRMARELRVTGPLQAHRDQKMEEAAELFRQLTDGLPTLPSNSGILLNPADEAQATEQVYAIMIEFPK